MTPASLPAALRRLESESIEILREVVATAARPVLLYSAGKDSSVLLHLAMKAFAPTKPPLHLLHIATGWDFTELLEFRDRRVAELGMRLIVFSNEDGLRRNITPLTAGATTHMQVMATEALRQALAVHGFDMAIGGARRDEERSRAKERIFSLRTSGQHWDPRRQRPELWNLYNPLLAPGCSMRVFPLSNWTEFDVWTYILCESVPVVPLYLARPRPVVRRGGTLIMVNDDRLPLDPGEVAEMQWVRFRTLGDWPLSGCLPSRAENISDMLAELRAERYSERHGRLIDTDQDASMERKKREGYF